MYIYKHMNRVSQHIADGLMWQNAKGNWCKRCPSCNREVVGKDGTTTTKFNVSHSIIVGQVCHSRIKIGKPTWSSLHREEWRRGMDENGHSRIGKHHTDEFKKWQRNRMIGTKLSGETKKKLSASVKLAMHRPDVRKRHIQGILHSPWLKVKTDKGQLELIEKWNRIGFKFEPNYQVHTDTDLFYVDGYDKEHNVVLEYDSKYHEKTHQKQKDLMRQNRVIDILHPKKFWRYNKVNGSFVECITQFKKEPATVVAEQKV